MHRMVVPSPIGSIVLTAKGGLIVGLDIGNDASNETGTGEENVLKRCAKELKEYFAGERTSFSVPVNAVGTTFEKKIWQLMAKTPYGSTISYAGIARKAGKPSAYRAVANACGKNPLLILIPCHRIIASDGTIGGFSAGVEKKKKLLALEKVST